MTQCLKEVKHKEEPEYFVAFLMMWRFITKFLEEEDPQNLTAIVEFLNERGFSDGIETDSINDKQKWLKDLKGLILNSIAHDVELLFDALVCNQKTVHLGFMAYRLVDECKTMSSKRSSKRKFIKYLLHFNIALTFCLHLF
jgi:hypothetical protein